MSCADEMLALLPPWYREVTDYQVMCQIEGPMYCDIRDAAQQVLDNFFPLKMDLGFIEGWESILGIVADPTTETLDYRRQRIVNRISTKPPFTLQFLYNKLDEIVGEGLWTVEIDYANYTLYIERPASGLILTTEFEWLISRIKPAHIAFVNRPYVETSIDITETVTIATGTWNYILGSWELGMLPFQTDREEQMVKSSDVQSIQPLVLETAANTVAEMIASVRLNGNIIITDMVKRVSGSSISVTVGVSDDTTSLITQEELLDESGNVLTSAVVNVPITGHVELVYRIPVEEGASIGNTE